MKKILLPILTVFIIPFITGCAEEDNAPTFSTYTASNIDTTNVPIEVGKLSKETYVLNIANPFTSNTYKSEDYANAVVRVMYNGKQIYNISKGQRLGSIVVIDSTCGVANDVERQTNLPELLQLGQSCQITYKLAPQSAFVYVEKFSIEYFNQAFFYGGTFKNDSGYSITVEPDQDINILNYE